MKEPTNLQLRNNLYNNRNFRYHLLRRSNLRHTTKCSKNRDSELQIRLSILHNLRPSFTLPHSFTQAPRNSELLHQNQRKTVSWILTGHEEAIKKTIPDSAINLEYRILVLTIAELRGKEEAGEALLVPLAAQELQTIAQGRTRR